ncbi:DnaA regulatory inactivator Hda [Parathalassolituus penaei]|uniref:DnaA regulatory inactivator Hda n=1 Tax=Parathalassolituus penaei TaxID=2997323 RepID=A0A9X3EDW3_9GAMM|nr:DnaA regulatory inactivator Hda [Parathalassolituus penaei]MCY0965808.1 DnaA regulatory inactivator Hda [Parathalassolituus penaei]
MVLNKSAGHHPQLTLSVLVRDDARFANFYAGANEELIQAVQKQWTLAGDPFLYIWGHPGSGRSHLLQAACHYADGLGHHSVYLPLRELVSYEPSVLEGLEKLPLVVLDDLDVIAGNEDWEIALFHLFNRIRDAEGHLLMAANVTPRGLAVALPDLASRLSGGVMYQLHSLQPEERALALVLRARRRGILLGEDVARFLVGRGPECMSGLADILDQLDQESLSQQRKLTIPFVKEVLGW